MADRPDETLPVHIWLMGDYVFCVKCGHRSKLSASSEDRAGQLHGFMMLHDHVPATPNKPS